MVKRHCISCHRLSEFFDNKPLMTRRLLEADGKTLALIRSKTGYTALHFAIENGKDGSQAFQSLLEVKGEEWKNFNQKMFRLLLQYGG